MGIASNSYANLSLVFPARALRGIIDFALSSLFGGGTLTRSATRSETDNGGQTLRFNSTFLELVRQHCAHSDSEADRVIRDIIKHRLRLGLDDKIVTPDPLRYDDETWLGEIRKLLTIYENIRTADPPEERPFMIEALKEKYSVEAVDEVVGDYFPELSRQTYSRGGTVAARL